MVDTQTAPTRTDVTRRRFLAATASAVIAGAGFAISGGMKPEIAYAETSAEVRAQANEVLAKLEKLQADLDIKSNTYYQCKAEEEEAERLMADAQRRIDEAQAKIDKLKAQIDTVKNVRRCPNCGKAQDSAGRFCAACGAAMP